MEFPLRGIDRVTFPSDAISTHMIWQPGLLYLKRWGLLDAVAKSNCPAIRTITFDMREFVLQGQAPVLDGIGVHYCVRRTVLDTILVDAAARSGAEVREAFTVDNLIVENGRVVGVDGHSRGSPVHGKAEDLARRAKPAVDLIGNAARPAPASGTGSALSSSIGAARIAQIVGHAGEQIGPVYKITIGPDDLTFEKCARRSTRAWA